MLKNLNIIKSFRSIKSKRYAALIMTFLMIFSGIPDLSGIISYAAAPTVQNIIIETLSSADKVETKVTVNGAALKDASVRINNKNLSTITGVRISNKENGFYEAVFAASQGFNFINGINNLQVTTIEGTVSKNFTMTSPFPTLTGVNRNIYVGKKVVINGTNLPASNMHPASAKLFIGLRENQINKAESNTTQLVVDTLDSQTGDIYDVEYQISYSAAGADEVPAVYSYILSKSVYPLKIIEGLENLRITPSKGPIRGGTVLSINAVRADGTIIDDKDLFKDGMTVQLRGAEPSNKAKLITIPSNQIEVVRTGTNGTGLTAVTSDVSAQSDVTGKYDVVIKQGTVSDAEAVAPEAFQYLSTMPSLDLRSIRDTKGKDTGDQAVILEGENIIDIESLGLTIEAGGSVSIPTAAAAEGGKLKLSYEVTGTPGKVKYGDFVINPNTVIERTIEVKIGNTAQAISGDIGAVKPPAIPAAGPYVHYIQSRGGKSDGVFFKTPSVNADTIQKYDVELETRTYITINGNVKLPVIIERDKISKGFEYIRTKINPKITAVEPAYGYYSKLEGKDLKPLVVRIKGSNFQVEKKEVNGELVSVYPEIRLTKLDGQSLFGANPDKIKVDVKKVLIGDRPVDGESDKYGDVIVAEVYPVDSSGQPDAAFKLNEEAGLWSNESLYKRLRTRFFIKQTSGDNSADTATDDQPYLEFRYPLSVSVGNIQPVIDNVYQNGFPVTSLSSDTENELEVKFKAANVTDLNSIILTLDGIDLGKSGKITARKLDGDFISIKFKTPKNLIGNVRLQVIVREGLMDSFDSLFFSPISGPVLKHILPNKGQKGTWTVIKRDAALAQSARFKMPDEKNADSTTKIESGSRIIYNGLLIPLISLKDDQVNGNYEVKDTDTIVFKIPQSSNIGINTVQVENPTGGRSQGVIFEVVNPATPTGIDSIDPDRGDKSGGITATIKAKPGTSFAGEVDIYLGSQKAQVTGYNIGYTEVYIKVPPFIEKTLTAGESYSVPVTAVNKERFSSDTLINGYTYINPSYKVEITSIFKEGSEAAVKNTGLAGDSVVIEGKEIRAVRQNGNMVKLPLVYFGNTRADVISWDITPGTPNDDGSDPDGQTVNLERIKVKAPTKPNSSSSEGAVTVMLINPDGATAIKEKGFIYTSGKPEIIKESSTLTASRFYDTINVFAKDVYKDGLVAAFGDRSYKKDLSTGEQKLVTDNEQEKLIFTFDPAASNNVKIQYQYIEGSTAKAIDFDSVDIYDYKNPSEGVQESSIKVLLGEENERLIGIKWNKEKYHKAVPFTNAELLSKLNDEIISVKIVKKPESTMNQIVIRRGLGKVSSYQLNAASKTANIRIETPYNDKAEKTKIQLINSDKSLASADFEFTGGTDAPVITEVAGTKSRQITLNNALQTSKVLTQDVNLETGIIKISGKNFFNIKSVRIGGTTLAIEAVSPDADWILAKVKKGTADLVQKPQVISVTTSSGSALSDAASVNEDKIYFMYISAGSAPVIKSIAPAKGITTGGNGLKITGEGFSNKDEFGSEGTSTAYQITVNVNGANAAINSIEKDANGQILSLSVTAPPADPGKAVLTLINGDGGSATSPFEYISQPKITAASTSTGKPVLFNDEDSEITLIGEQFQTGAKIYIGSVISDKKTEGAIKAAGTKGLTAEKVNKEVYVTGGYEASTVTFINSKTIKFKMPKGLTQLENKSIIVVNPDTGVSDGFEDGSIKPPVPDVPVIEAIPGYERSMILKWNVDKETLNAAEKFEIYARNDNRGEYLFVGDTKGTQFTVKGLKADTRYQFKVRVLNKYGSADDVGYVSEKTLKASQDYKEKDKIAEAEKAVDTIKREGKSQIVGNTLVYTTGSSDSYINLKDSKQTEKHILISADDIKNAGRTITIEDKDMTLTIPYSSLNVNSIRNASKNGYMRIKISSAAKQMQESIKISLPRSMTLSSSAYYIGFESVDGTSTESVTQLASNVQLFIKTSDGKGSLYRYDESADSLISVGNLTAGTAKGGYYVLVSPK